jgi:hypothetical protein
MRWVRKTLHVIMLVMALVPGWLYASGNLPSFFPHNKSIIRAINISFPDLSYATFQKSHQAFEKLREQGVEIPYTYNERYLRIREIRHRVIRICNHILLY